MRRIIAAFAALTLSVIAPSIPTAYAQDERCFPETNQCISGVIRQYWEDNGGLPVFGYPITALATETNADGFTGPTQWFERDRLEDHSAEGTGVLAGRLGAQKLEIEGRPWQTFPQAHTAPAECVVFHETGHSLCPPFRAYWEGNGGLARFGYPISEPVSERNADGFSGTFQWFERRRMEAHPENQPPFDILLGLLGNEVHDGALAPAPAPSPAPQPAGIPVLSHSTYVDAVDVRWIVGEIRNDTARNVQFTKVVATLYNAGDQVVATETTYAQLQIIKPGQRSPFAVIVLKTPADFVRYALQVEGSPTDSQPLEGVVITSQGDRDAGVSGTRYLFGEVRNDSGGPVRFTEIIATLYDASGMVVGVATGYTSLERLEAGDTSPFQIITTRWQNVARYELQIEAKRP